MVAQSRSIPSLESSPRSGSSCHASLCSSEVDLMSAFGPEQTSASAPHMYAFRGKADMIRAKSGHALPPTKISNKRPVDSFLTTDPLASALDSIASFHRVPASDGKH